jgi:hypothetical protein
MADKYITADDYDPRQPDPLSDVPADIKQAIYETRALNAAGICGVKDCGQPLYDSIGCKEHAQSFVTNAERLESRAKRLGVFPKHRPPKVY